MEQKKGNRRLQKGLLLCLGAVGGWQILRNLGNLVISLMTSQKRTAASIGIIGGADGPTAVFVTYRTPELPQLLAAAAVAAVCLWAFFRRRRKKRNQ